MNASLQLVFSVYSQILETCFEHKRSAHPGSIGGFSETASDVEGDGGPPHRKLSFTSRGNRITLTPSFAGISCSAFFWFYLRVPRKAVSLSPTF
jgi:hypothetical protein